MHLQENTLFGLAVLPSTLYIMWPIHLHGLRLLLPTVKEEMHLQENTLFDHSDCVVNIEVHVFFL